MNNVDGDGDFGDDPQGLDEEQARLVRRQIAIEARAQIGLKRLMGDSDARAWVWSILRFCHTTEPSFSRDALVMSFKEGERNVGQKLLADIHNVAEDEYVLMAREAKVEGQ